MLENFQNIFFLQGFLDVAPTSRKGTWGEVVQEVWIPTPYLFQYTVVFIEKIL